VGAGEDADPAKMVPPLRVDASTSSVLCSTGQWTARVAVPLGEIDVLSENEPWNLGFWFLPSILAVTSGLETSNPEGITGADEGVSLDQWGEFSAGLFD